MIKLIINKKRFLIKHMIIIICFINLLFLFACGIKSVKTIVDENNNLNKEKLLDIDEIIKTNTNDKIMELFGSLFIYQKRFDINGKIYDIKKSYEDENKNKAYYYYKVKENYDNELEAINNNFFDIRYNEKYYIANNNHIVGFNYEKNDEIIKLLDTKNCIQMYNEKNKILLSYERITDHFYDIDNNEGVIKTFIADFKNSLFLGLDKKYIDILGINDIIKIVNTYFYDVDTYNIKKKIVEVINGKGNSYLVEEVIFTYGEGMYSEPFDDLITKLNDNKIQDVKFIEEKNTYDSVLKKHNNLSISTYLNKDSQRLLAYETYGDFRGIKLYKSWDYTMNTLYEKAMRHIRNAEGKWFKIIRNNEVEIDNTMTTGEKGYYEKYNPIESIFENKSLLMDDKYLKINYLDGDKGHILYETDSIKNVYKNYRESIVEDLDKMISNIIVDYIYNTTNFDIEKVEFIVSKKDGTIDKNIIELNINYDIETPSYLRFLYIDEDFKLDYEKLVKINTENNLLSNYSYITIKDARWKNAIEKDKEILLTKYDNGEFIIKDDERDSYIKDKENHIYVEGASTNGLKKEITNKNLLDISIKNAFEWDNIISAFHNDKTKDSLINTEYKIIAAYNDVGKGKLITSNDEGNLRIEYVFDLKTKVIEDIKYYEISDYGMILKYATYVEVGKK